MTYVLCTYVCSREAEFENACLVVQGMLTNEI